MMIQHSQPLDKLLHLTTLNKTNNFSNGLELIEFLGTPVSHVAAIFPRLGRIFTKLEDHKASYTLLSDKIQSLIDEHKKSFDGENPNNFIDHCLVRLENEKESGNNLSQEEEDEMFRTLIVDILIVSAIYSGKQQGVYTMLFYTEHSNSHIEGRQ